MTTATRACSRPAWMASISACKLLPLPDSSTPRRRGSGIAVGERETACAARDGPDDARSRAELSKMRQSADRVRRLEDEDEADAVVERAVHLVTRHVPELFDQGEDR